MTGNARDVSIAHGTSRSPSRSRCSRSALTLDLRLARARQARRPRPRRPVPVLVASRDIPIGTRAPRSPAAAGSSTKTLPAVRRRLGRRRRRRAARDARRDPADLQRRAARLAALRHDAAGGPASPRCTARTASCSCRATRNQLLAGTLKDGNRVDVVGSIKVPGDEPDALQRTIVPAQPARRRRAAPKPAPGRHDGNARSSCASRPRQAQRLFWLEKNADWSLLLRPATQAPTTSRRRRRPRTLLGAPMATEPRSARRPRRRRPRRPRPSRPTSRRSTRSSSSPVGDAAGARRARARPRAPAREPREQLAAAREHSVGAGRPRDVELRRASSSAGRSTPASPTSLPLPAAARGDVLRDREGGPRGPPAGPAATATAASSPCSRRRADRASRSSRRTSRSPLRSARRSARRCSSTSTCSSATRRSCSASRRAARVRELIGTPTDARRREARGLHGAAQLRPAASCRRR